MDEHMAGFRADGWHTKFGILDFGVWHNCGHGLEVVYGLGVALCRVGLAWGRLVLE